VTLTSDRVIRRVLIAMAAVTATLPGLLVLTGVMLAAPGEGILMVVASVITAVVALAWLARNWTTLVFHTRRTSNWTLLTVVVIFAISSLLFMLLWERCIINHPGYGETMVFPIWTTGRLTTMIASAGSRFDALDRYGPAAIYDAMAAMPGTPYAVTRIALAAGLSLPVASLAVLFGLLAIRETTVMLPIAASADADEPFEYDAFICHNSLDKPAMKAMVAELAARGVRAFLDENDLAVGQSWIDEVEAILRRCRAMIVVVGPHGLGSWQKREIVAILHEQERRRCAVIPVFLPEVPPGTSLPLFLSGLTWVDFRKASPDGWSQLVRGIMAAAKS
jgi:TIR domain